MKRRTLCNIYDHGFPFSKIVALNILDCLEEIENRKASLIIIDGKMGQGKTTLAYEIGQFVESHYSRKKKINFYNPLCFNPQDQIGMGGLSFQEKLEVCNGKKLKVVVYDEAGDFSKRGALSGFNAELTRLFQTFRTFKILVIVCLPYFNVLDNNLFDEGVPRLLLNLHSRNEDYGNIRGYGYDEMLWLRYYMTQEKVKKQNCYKRVTPNFRAKFLDLPIKLSDELDQLSTDGKKNILNKSILKGSGLLSYKEIAKNLFKSVSWVKLTVSKLNIKESRIYKKNKYFDNAVVEVLRNKIK